MTNQNHSVCPCTSTSDALHLALHERPMPTCETHGVGLETTGAPIALNDGKALANLIGANLKNGNL